MVKFEEIAVGGDILKLVPRSEWGAKSPQSPLEPFGILAAKYIIIGQYNEAFPCETVDECCACIRHLQTYHMAEKGFDDIAFNFVVGNGGIVFEARGHEWRAATAKNWNSVSFGVAFLGRFEPNNEHCKAAIDAAQLLFKYLVDRGKLDKDYIVYGLRQVRPFNTPTKELYDVIKSWSHWEDRPCAPTYPLDNDVV